MSNFSKSKKSIESKELKEQNFKGECSCDEASYDVELDFRGLMPSNS